MPKFVRMATLALFLAGAGNLAHAQAEEKEPRKYGWFNSTELSLVVTKGNSDVETLGFKNKLRRVWEKQRFQLKLDAVKSDTADDVFALEDPDGPYTDPVTGVNYIVVEPSVEPDVEKYFTEARYDREITNKFSWNAGASWQRDVDAGLINRYIGFGGLGHLWWDRDDLAFSTTYGISYTDREEEIEDPLKEDQFAGLRLSWDYMNKWGKLTTFDQDVTFNMSFEDASDYSMDMTNALSVAMSKRISLKISLQWLYNNEPALDGVDLDQDILVELPNGDTVLARATIGEVNVRKDQLDTVFNTALVINF